MLKQRVFDFNKTILIQLCLITVRISLEVKNSQTASLLSFNSISSEDHGFSTFDIIVSDFVIANIN